MSLFLYSKPVHGSMWTPRMLCNASRFPSARSNRQYSMSLAVRPCLIGLMMKLGVISCDQRWLYVSCISLIVEYYSNWNPSTFTSNFGFLFCSSVGYWYYSSSWCPDFLPELPVNTILMNEIIIACHCCCVPLGDLPVYFK